MKEHLDLYQLGKSGDQSAPAPKDLAGYARNAHGFGGGGSCCQPFACEYVQPQGTSCVCSHPSSVGV